MALTTEMHLPSEQKHDGHTFTYTGKFRYMITLATYESKLLFTDEGHVRQVLDRLSTSSRTHHFEVLAYCFLPEKLVIVIGGKEETSDMRAFLADFRASSGEALASTLKHPVWGRRYLERVVRKREDLHMVIREIFRLPVKAGLADSPAKYLFQGSFTGLTPSVTLPRDNPRRQTVTPRRSGGGPRHPGGGKPGARNRGR